MLERVVYDKKALQILRALEWSIAFIFGGLCVLTVQWLWQVRPQEAAVLLGLPAIAFVIVYFIAAPIAFLRTRSLAMAVQKSDERP